VYEVEDEGPGDKEPSNAAGPLKGNATTPMTDNEFTYLGQSHFLGGRVCIANQAGREHPDLFAGEEVSILICCLDHFEKRKNPDKVKEFHLPVNKLFKDVNERTLEAVTGCFELVDRASGPFHDICFWDEDGCRNSAAAAVAYLFWKDQRAPIGHIVEVAQTQRPMIVLKDEDRPHCANLGKFLIEFETAVIEQKTWKGYHDVFIKQTARGYTGKYKF